MRTIGQQFKNDRGQTAFHFGVIYADQWSSYGFPELTMAERNTWSFLWQRTSKHRCSIAEVSLRVWGSKNHRKSAKRALISLQKLGLAEDDEGWFCRLPSMLSAANNSNWDESGDSPCNSLEDESGDSGGESGDSGGGESGDSGRMSQVTHPMMRDIRDSTKRQQQQPARSTENHKSDIAKKAVDVVFKSPNKKTARESLDKILELGLEKAMTKAARLLDPLRVPESEPDLSRFIALAVAAVSARAKPKSPSAYHNRMLEVFQEDHRAALAALQDVIQDRREAKATAAKKQREALQRAQDHPQPPEWDDALDDPQIKPREWISQRMPSLSRRVERVRSSASPALEHLRLKLENLEHDFLQRWERAGSKNQMGATPMRRNYAQVMAKITNQAEGLRDEKTREEAQPQTAIH